MLDLNWLLKIEERGRRLAIGNPTVAQAKEWFDRAQEAFATLYGFFNRTEFDNGALSALNGNDAMYYAQEVMEYGQPAEPAQVPWRMDYEEKFRACAKLDDAGKFCHQLIGKKCSWLSYNEWTKSVTAFINDATAILHRLIEGAGIYIRRENEVKCPKVHVHTLKPKDYFIKVACAFGYAERAGHRLCLYFEPDYENTFANIYDNRVDMSVGDAPGHRSVITENYISYFDTDLPVNWTMARLLQSIGANPETHRLGVNATHSGVNPVKLGVVMALATSMDYRIEIYDTLLKEHSLNADTVEAYWPFACNPPKVRIYNAVLYARRRHLQGPDAYYVIESTLGALILTRIQRYFV